MIALEVEDEHRAHQIDHLVDDARGDDLAAQAVLRDFGGERGGDRRRKIGPQEAIDEVWIVDQRGLFEARGEIDLGVGGEHRELRTSQAGEASAPIAQLLVRRQDRVGAADEPRSARARSDDREMR